MQIALLLRNGGQNGFKKNPQFKSNQYLSLDFN
jgi:hypothetical protein